MRKSSQLGQTDLAVPVGNLIRLATEAESERLIGSIRRECLDHVVVFGERHLRHLLLSDMNYTHLSLDKDAPLSRTVQRVGRILRLPILGGLHHQYIRI